MAVIVIIELPGVTKEKYQASHAAIHKASWWPVDGFISHAGAPADDGWLVVDLWDSREAFMAFREKAGPIFQENDMPMVEPQLYEAVNVDTR
ncbi:hypothetical protein J7E93_26865 [Streptomyces sp. ISL-36]|uniref:hypothetical protein n=1 Tax=Streptomyces sp. ISL-36 TaxID=2819182 RepID=UPI001BE9E888|nr:hypothetical protein [Streptomyces sp. ISL-36]MBT2443653.1 hypothetical protein [Streptomyces sp. ISL-36]